MQTTAAPELARACESCSQAKAKCRTQPEGSSGSCARCLRLKRDCVFRPRAGRKRRSPNAASNSTQLEQKIESLVTLLSATPGFLELPPPASISGSKSANETAIGSSQVAHNESPDVRLRRFRDLFAVHFPYAIVPAGVTASELRDTQPWLYKTIMIVTCSSDRNQQVELGNQTTMEIAIAMLIRGERNLDMLQGVLVYNTWSYYFSSVAPQSLSTGMLQLGRALLFDLGLNRAVREDEGGPGEILADAPKRAWPGPECVAMEMKRTLFERRALLYSYFLASVASICLKKVDSLQNIPYIEYSCRVILEAVEDEHDHLLVALVRLQVVVESVNRNLANRPSSSDGSKAPIWMHVASAQRQLQDILISLPANLQSHPLLRMTYHTAELSLLECSILKTQFPPNFSSQRLDMLYACLLSTKALLDIFIAQPISSYSGFSSPNLIQLTHGISTLFRLGIIKEVGWDLAHVRQTVDLVAYLDRLISHFEKAGAEIDQVQNAPCKESFPTGCSRALTIVKGWYLTMSTSEPETEGMQDQNNSLRMDDLLNGNTFHYLDEAYWQDMIAEFNNMTQ